MLPKPIIAGDVVPSRRGTPGKSCLPRLDDKITPAQAHGILPRYPKMQVPADTTSNEEKENVVPWQ